MVPFLEKEFLNRSNRVRLIKMNVVASKYMEPRSSMLPTKVSVAWKINENSPMSKEAKAKSWIMKS